MCEWSGHYVRVNMECASIVMCERLVMCESKCASASDDVLVAHLC